MINRCRSCGLEKHKYTLKLIFSNRATPYPKVIPQIKCVCDSCQEFIGFAPQTPELISRFNSKLEEIWLESE